MFILKCSQASVEPFLIFLVKYSYWFKCFQSQDSSWMLNAWQNNRGWVNETHTYTHTHTHTNLHTHTYAHTLTHTHTLSLSIYFSRSSYGLWLFSNYFSWIDWYTQFLHLKHLSFWLFFPAIFKAVVNIFSNFSNFKV